MPELKVGRFFPRMDTVIQGFIITGSIYKVNVFFSTCLSLVSNSEVGTLLLCLLLTSGIDILNDAVYQYRVDRQNKLLRTFRKKQKHHVEKDAIEIHYGNAEPGVFPNWSNRTFYRYLFTTYILYSVTHGFLLAGYTVLVIKGWSLMPIGAFLFRVLLFNIFLILVVQGMLCVYLPIVAGRVRSASRPYHERGPGDGRDPTGGDVEEGSAPDPMETAPIDEN
eukprot:TRINITY_DN6618_c0_g1_i2.p1 TRINITY_DN6618_c0_g1~~TRINITY_DN6618_c0_g1_i2.p1  ORF type:complete len:222 (+),score=15.07 TRINITY_DN6618_c0_g1_i2:312-977(+)